MVTDKRSKTLVLPWDPHFLQKNKAFEIFNTLNLSLLKASEWPNLETLNRIAKQNHFQGYEFVSMSSQSKNYEKHIFATRTIPTRYNNWHDHFNFLCWLTFPKTKSQLNRSQCEQMAMRSNQQRTPLENALTLFDENGIVIVSSNLELLSDIKLHRWQELFWQKRQQLQNSFQCIVFGHSLHEKLLSPYIGMTGHAILLPVDSAYFQWNQIEQLNYLDDTLSSVRKFESTKDLSPFPLLGMPGWHSENAEERFYLNQHYFRIIR